MNKNIYIPMSTKTEELEPFVKQMNRFSLRLEHGHHLPFRLRRKRVILSSMGNAK